MASATSFSRWLDELNGRYHVVGTALPPPRTLAEIGAPPYKGKVGIVVRPLVAPPTTASLRRRMERAGLVLASAASSVPSPTPAAGPRVVSQSSFRSHTALAAAIAEHKVEVPRRGDSGSDGGSGSGGPAW